MRYNAAERNKGHEKYIKENRRNGIRDSGERSTRLKNTGIGRRHGEGE